MADPKGESLKADLSKLESLSAEAQARVSSALKGALEREVAATSRSPELAAQFSRGWIFSRVTSMNRDDVVLPAELQAMSEADFAQFATRLAKLKQMKDG